MKKNTLLIISCYAAIYLIWGTTYFFIAKAVETIPPAWILSTRFILGGAVITIIPVLGGSIKRLPVKEEVGASIFLGFFLLIMGNGVVTVAEMWVDSYVASLLISTVPLIVVIWNLIIYKSPLNKRQVLGFFIGFTGVAFLLYSDSPRETNELRGIILIFIAITCWGFGTSWSKKLKFYPNTFFATGMQMLFAGFFALVAALITGGDFMEIINGISSISLLSLIFLTFVGGTAIGAYNYLLKYEPTGRITSYALVNPMIATLLGIIIGGETPARFLIPGIIMILTGLTFMLYLSNKS